MVKILLRQEQKLKWNPKTKVQKFAMDAQCIRYHLNMLIFVFNNRFISNNDFITNFLHIAPFSDANKKTVEILLFGVAENKTNELLFIFLARYKSLKWKSVGKSSTLLTI